MGVYKKRRRYTVTEYYNHESKKSRPALRICGEWLRDLGFETGKKVIVSCEGGRLTIELADEIIQKQT